MADAKITALTEDTAPQPTDILATVDDPAGTPVTKKAQIANLPLSNGLLNWVSGVYYTGQGGATEEEGTNAITADILYALPIKIPNTGDVTADRISIDVTSAAGGGSLARLGIYQNSNGVPGALLLDAGTVAVDGTGAQEASISQVLSADKWYWLALVSDSTPTLRSSLNARLNASYMGYTRPNLPLKITGYTVSHSFAALPDPFGSGTADTGVFPLIFLRSA